MTYDVGATNIPMRQHPEKYDNTRTCRGHGIEVGALRNVVREATKKPGRRKSEMGRS
jgi:hypothetical protein